MEFKSIEVIGVLKLLFKWGKGSRKLGFEKHFHRKVRLWQYSSYSNLSLDLKSFHCFTSKSTKSEFFSLLFIVSKCKPNTSTSNKIRLIFFFLPLELIYMTMTFTACLEYLCSILPKQSCILWDKRKLEVQSIAWKRWVSAFPSTMMP